MEGLILKLIVICLTVLTLEANETGHSRSKRAPTDWLSSKVLNETAIQLILDNHNSKRRSVKYGSNINEVYWDEELARLAKDHSKKCVIDHVNSADFGENFFITESDDFDLILNGFVDAWYKEGNFYDYEENACVEEKVCGHYTQLVWAETNAIGCGVSQCSKIDTISENPVYIVVCNYAPKGNIVLDIDGIKLPLHPYKWGDPCTNCESGTTCKDGLCARTVTATTPAQTVPDIFNIAQESTTKSEDMCYQQNKKIIDKWEENLGEWRSDVERWRQNMDKYEAYLKKEVE